MTIPTPTTSTHARPSGETVTFTEWTSGAYTLRKSENDDYTVWTVHANGRGLPRVEDAAGIGQTPNFGVSFPSQSDLDPIEATAYAGQIMGAAQAALAFNKIVAPTGGGTTTPKGTTMQPQKHYTVIVRDAKTGKLLGRLCPDGTATNRVIYAAMLGKEQAEEIAAEINTGDEFTATVRPF